MTRSPTSSSAPKRRVSSVEPPPLARFLPLKQYAPEIGDFIVWAGWFRTWYGVIGSIDSTGQTLTVIWESLPMLLFTLTDQEQQAASKPLGLGEILTARPGKFAVMKHDAEHNTPIWFI